ncbi:3930_t:CDS:1, partial [Racocetra fulgida]
IESPIKDANSVLMNNTRQLHIPKKLIQENNYNHLYNELIDLFEEK